MARTARRGHRASRSVTSGAASSRCSKLSRTSSRWRSRRASPRRSTGDRPPASTTPRAWAIVGATRAGSRTAARGTNAAPWAKSAAQVGGDLEGEAGLADAAGAGQRHQPDTVPAEQRGDRRHLALAADQRARAAPADRAARRPSPGGLAALRHRRPPGPRARRRSARGRRPGRGPSPGRGGGARPAPARRPCWATARPAPPAPPASGPRPRGRAAAARRRRRPARSRRFPVVRPSPAPHRLRAPHRTPRPTHATASG